MSNIWSQIFDDHKHDRRGSNFSRCECRLRVQSRQLNVTKSDRQRLANEEACCASNLIDIDFEVTRLLLLNVSIHMMSLLAAQSSTFQEATSSSLYVGISRDILVTTTSFS
jgi:hypothetical protein